jgi:hypothetical protein
MDAGEVDEGGCGEDGVAFARGDRHEGEDDDDGCAG